MISTSKKYVRVAIDDMAAGQSIKNAITRKRVQRKGPTPFYLLPPIAVNYCQSHEPGSALFFMKRFLIYLLLSAALWSASALALAADLLDAGIQAYNQQRYQAAYQQLLPLAEQGDGEAQYYVGSMLVDGLGVSADPAKGVNFLEQAVSNKNHKAAKTLGKMYMSGFGVAMDMDKGTKYILLSDTLAPEDEPECD